jgi:hypothetical protein
MRKEYNVFLPVLYKTFGNGNNLILGFKIILFNLIPVSSSISRTAASKNASSCSGSPFGMLHVPKSG